LVIGSPEYFAKNGSNNASFVDALYHDVLRRGQSGGEGQGFVNVLGSGLSRNAVADVFLKSPEYHGLLVTAPDVLGPGTIAQTGFAADKLLLGYYQTLLGRNPSASDAGGVAGFTAELQGGVSDDFVIAQILSSQEFILKVQPS